MKPTKAIKAMQSMQEYLKNKIGIAAAECRDPLGYDLRNMAALDDALGLYGKLMDFIARQRAEGGAARLSPEQWDAWCIEVLGDVLPPHEPVDVVKMMDKHHWQPINTAPKDGTSVLIYVPNSTRKKVLEAYWCRPCEAATDDQCWWSSPYGIDGKGYTYLQKHVTHWMEMPDPPIEKDQIDIVEMMGD